METNRKPSPEKNSGNSVLRSEASLGRVNEEYTNENTRNIREHIFSGKIVYEKFRQNNVTEPYSLNSW